MSQQKKGNKALQPIVAHEMWQCVEWQQKNFGVRFKGLYIINIIIDYNEKINCKTKCKYM